MSSTKKLVYALGWVAAFFILNILLNSADLSVVSKDSDTNTFILLLLAATSLVPLIMAVLVFFDRPRGFYDKNK